MLEPAFQAEVLPTAAPEREVRPAPSMVTVSADIVGARGKAYKVYAFGRRIWLPKSQVTVNGGQITMPLWLARQKGLAGSAIPFAGTPWRASESRKSTRTSIGPACKVQRTYGIIEQNPNPRNQMTPTILSEVKALLTHVKALVAKIRAKDGPADCYGPDLMEAIYESEAELKRLFPIAMEMLDYMHYDDRREMLHDADRDGVSSITKDYLSRV